MRDCLFIYVIVQGGISSSLSPFNRNSHFHYQASVILMQVLFLLFIWTDELIYVGGRAGIVCCLRISLQAVYGHVILKWEGS